jgi:hypothetical protein
MRGRIACAAVCGDHHVSITNVRFVEKLRTNLPVNPVDHPTKDEYR